MTASKEALRTLLASTFDNDHIEAAVEHYELLTLEFQKRSWEDALIKASKFVEAVLKALWVYAKKTPAAADKDFKVDNVIHALEVTEKTAAATTIRVTIPRACRFTYEIASNRGARHDPGEIDPNEMDATVALANCSWILAEMLRFATRGKPDEAHEWVARLIKRRVPIYEEVEGRGYFHIKGLKPREIALLNLWRVWPDRMSLAALIEAVVRRESTENAARLGIRRLNLVVDDDGARNLRLLAPGVQEAEELLAQSAQPKPPKRRARRRR